VVSDKRTPKRRTKKAELELHQGKGKEVKKCKWDNR